MDWWGVILKSSRSSVIFAFALIVMVAGIYPNYNIIEIGSGVKGCILSSVAHHYIGNSIICSVVAIVFGSIGYIFIPKNFNDKNISNKKIMIFCWFFIVISVCGNYWSSVFMAEFFEKSSQPFINAMSKPLDHYICTEAQSKVG